MQLWGQPATLNARDDDTWFYMVMGREVGVGVVYSTPRPIHSDMAQGRDTILHIWCGVSWGGCLMQDFGVILHAGVGKVIPR